MEQSKIETKQPVSTYLPKEENGMSYPVNSTALLVIDPVNDFLSEGGAGDPATKQAQPFLRTKANSQQQGEGITAGPRRPVECKNFHRMEKCYM